MLLACGASLAVVLLATQGVGHAASGFSFQRLSGNTRFDSACQIALDAFDPQNNVSVPDVIMADGLPSHQVDALAAPYLAGGLREPILLTNDSSDLPGPTASCLQAMKVTHVTLVGGQSSIPSGQVTEMQQMGLSVDSTSYAGSDRFQTMEMIDESSAVSPGGAPTAVLVSGDNDHLADGLGAGPLAFALHFPIILTESTGCDLPSSAESVLEHDDIHRLIVVGGTESVPACQYQNLPSSIVADTSATTGSTRGQTSYELAGDEVANYGGSTAYMGIATSTTYVGNTSNLQDDGADALAAAELLGSQTWASSHPSSTEGYVLIPLLLFDSPDRCSSAVQWSMEHGSTLDATSPAFGGNSSLAQSCVTEIENPSSG